MAVPAVITARLGSVLAKRLTDVQLQLAFNGLSAALIPTYLAVQHYAQTRDAEAHAPQDAAAPLRRTLTEHQALHRTADAECHAEARGPAGLASRLLPLRPQDMAFGALSGVLSSLVGVGGLPIAMSYLTVSTDLPHHLVQGTAVLAVAPSVLVSALSRLSVIPVVTTVAVCGERRAARRKLSRCAVRGATPPAVHAQPGGARRAPVRGRLQQFMNDVVSAARALV